MDGGRRGEGGTDPWEEGGSDVKGRSAGKMSRRWAAEVVWGEGGWGIKIDVGVSAKLGGRWGRHGEMQTAHGKADYNGEQGKDCYWGDFNDSIGRGVCGKYGLGRGNEAGRDLVDWCEELGMAHVNSFMKYKRRGTWRHPATGRWHKLDGFLVRGEERQRMMRKVRTREERELSDHRPVCMRLNVEWRRWRTEGRKERRVPRMR